MFFNKRFMCVLSLYVFFDGKCKSLNRLGEHIENHKNKTQKKNTAENKQRQFREQQNRNTGYPALDPTNNKYLSGSGWEIMFCFNVFP